MRTSLGLHVKLRKPGQFIQVQGSVFLGTPPCWGRIVTVIDQDHYEVNEVLTNDGHFQNSGDVFDVNHEGIILVGPPLNGKLVLAP